MHDIHKEISFEDEICAHLSKHGWLYAKGDAQHYDRERALFPADLVAWVKESQPKAWEALVKNHGSQAETTLLTRVRDQLNQRGSLDVLRNGVELLGLRQALRLAQFKPAFALNPEIQSRYEANRLRVVRQVHYSLYNENSIDLVLFLNGLPIATAELKTDFTQCVGDAIDQYRYDRNPKPKGQNPEPLLSFPSGALVHFAVSNREVHMTTKLVGGNTFFLPFNLGNNGGAGNPLNPNGHSTSYLWEQVWQREGWLEILGRYLISEKDKKGKINKVIFPRYHQLDATRKLQQAVVADGPGTKYLVQHSAGSGKTNSIAWTAHFFSELHDAKDEKVFDSVIVVSDRNVIDSQLQDALFNFQRKTGVVARIDGKTGSKSAALAEALSGDKKIVVCTIQTFPFALEKVRELAATEGKRFAVIADEAHSSQTGEAAAKLKAVLSPEELEEINDGGEISAEDILAAQMTARADDQGVTFVAFTATPKGKTLEIFGTRPDPSRKPAEDNVPRPFHVYSMRQAIEEGFILDVLKNYTNYKLAFKLSHQGKDYDDTQVEKSTAMKGIMGWVRLHPYNISQKVEIIVEHYRQNVTKLLDGKAKAMVVVGSRKEAVRWSLAINQYIKEKGYGYGTLVAFSGKVSDPESGPDEFTETSETLNSGLHGRDIREAFKDEAFHILLVANKFQTGFDQPLLCAMYVDKRLSGIQAVQTLSRLNRCHPGKDTTYVVDFANEAEDILKSFQVYYETAELETTTDPNLVYNLRAKLDGAGFYDDNEVDRVVNIELRYDATQAMLFKAIEPVADRLLKRFKAATAAYTQAKEKGDDSGAKAAKEEMDCLTLFKADLGAFLRLYTFLSQIFDYGNTDIEKRAIFYKHLVRLLDFGRERDGIDLSKVKLTHHKLNKQKNSDTTLGEGKGEYLKPITESGSGSIQEKQKVQMSAIIEQLNELFGTETTDDDQLIYVNNVILGKLLESDKLRTQAQSNSKEQFASSPDLMPALQDAIIEALDAHSTMSTKALNSKDTLHGILRVLLNHANLWEKLRGDGDGE
ncbi:type I restriction endonuclease subunit R [Sulfuriroseicoccus oceanibius]|uniref:Type I restriction endonuclease subunit R n=1 Tax=Sulfuriroseicoccus oceanibius TaxID=2707525 RepID=A0A6B3L144_9BACT|nr:DEAD/DEAH box helicase family protein [Sulfuriroseicoccus oceanibius]QQL43713.1 type I restriction endonuclease subunit R [Sulfuriroseicoccus oceanibius]